jgi:hypothetical protein
MIEDLTKNAAEAYGKIITRYPAMDRAVDAKARLEALHQPVPRPTRAALEQNKKEVASRHEARHDVDHAVGNLREASRRGEGRACGRADDGRSGAGDGTEWCRR